MAHVYSVYEIEGPDAIYVGSTVKTLARRLREHDSQARCSKYRSALHVAIRKHGIAAFSIAAVGEFPSMREARNAELSLMRQHDRNGVRLYNVRRAASGRIGSHEEAFA
jgi:hypothetical protein